MSQFATLDTLAATIAARAEADPAQSYAAKLLSRGAARIAKKLGEEAVEAAIAAAQGHRDEAISESADLLFHLLLLWQAMGIPATEVMDELQRREAMSGLEEKASRPPE